MPAAALRWRRKTEDEAMDSEDKKDERGMKPWTVKIELKHLSW